jgi:hypothetical protein
MSSKSGRGGEGGAERGGAGGGGECVVCEMKDGESAVNERLQYAPKSIKE